MKPRLHIIFAALALAGAASSWAREANRCRFAMRRSPIGDALLPMRPEPPRMPPPAAVEPFISLEHPAAGDEVVEGEKVTVRWRCSPDVRQVRLYYYGPACPVGGKARGKFDGFVTQMTPNEGHVMWTAPWMDGLKFRLRIAGFDAEGERLAADEQTISFRPRIMVDIEPTCIVVDRARQRLYYQEDGKILLMHIVSTARRGYVTPPMRPGERWRGVVVGRVFGKKVRAWSRRYQCPMPFWLAITSSGSHGIHAATRQAQRFLGRPASHGCIRQDRSDAKALFDLVKVGTAVYVY